MTSTLPELRRLAPDLVLDGELIGWKGREPWFPNECRRVLNYDLSVQIPYIVFDLLRINRTDLTERTFAERRDILAGLGLDAPDPRRYPHDRLRDPVMVGIQERGEGAPGAVVAAVPTRRDGCPGGC